MFDLQKQISVIRVPLRITFGCGREKSGQVMQPPQQVDANGEVSQRHEPLLRYYFHQFGPGNSVRVSV